MGMSKRKTDKNKKRWFSRKKIFPALIVFMVIFLIVSVTESIIYYRDSKVNAGEPVVTEDGKFDIPKCNSDSEKGTKDNPFVVLEIVPGASSAQFGYLVGGQEPIDIEKALKEDPAAKDVLSKYVEVGEDGSYTNTDLFKKFGIGLAYKDNDIANGEEISKFEFGGWYLEKECVNPVDADMRLTKDTTVYAKWTAVYPTDEVNRVAGKDETYKPQYTVKFDANCGDAQDSVVGMPEDIKHIEEDSTIVEPNAVPRRKDKLFAGWFTDKECTKSYSFKDRFSGKDRVITLYAKWVDMPDVKFTLKFEPNAEGVSDMPGTIENYAKNGMSVDFADVTPQNEPKMAGYLFTGWYYDSACTRKFEFNSTIPDDIENALAEAEGEKVISLYAGWAKDDGKTYTLHFDINKPSGADKDEVKKCEDSLEDLESDASGRVNGLGDKLKKTLVIEGNVAKKVKNYNVKVITTTPEDFFEYGYKYMQHGDGRWVHGQNRYGEHNLGLIDRADMIFISEGLHEFANVNEFRNISNPYVTTFNSPDVKLMYLFYKYKKTKMWYDRQYNTYTEETGGKPEPAFFGMYDDEHSIDFDWRTTMRLLKKNTVGSKGDGTDAVPIIYDLKSIGTVLPNGDTTLRGAGTPDHKEEFTTSDGKNVSLESTGTEYLGKCSDRNTHKLYLMLMQMDPVTVYNAYIEGESRYGRICVDGEHAGCFEYYDAENDRHVYTDKWTFNTLMPVETMSEEVWKEYTDNDNCRDWKRTFKQETPYDTTGIPGSIGYNDYPKLQDSAIYYNALATDTTPNKEKNDDKGSTLVLELLARSTVTPDEGMKDFIPEEVVKTEGYNTTNALYYLLNGNKAPKKYEDTVRVLDIEPTDGENVHKDKSYWFWYISKYIRNFTGDVKVTETTTWEFAGNIDDLNSEYDLVYIGDSMIDPEEQTGSNIKDKEKDKNLKDFIRNFVPGYDVEVIENYNKKIKKKYYLYSHNGAVIDNEKLAIRSGSLGDTTADSAITKFMASGNDITKIKYNDLLKYAEAGYPIVFGRNLFKSSYITGKLSADDINTGTVDKASYIYKLMDTLVTGNKYRSSVFSENENYESRKTDFVNALTENKFALKISSLPVEYIDRSLSKYKDYADRDVYINGDDIDNKVLEYKIRIDSDKSKKYTLNVYIDTNADGRFNDNERLDALEIRDVTDGRIVRYNNLTGSHTFTIRRDIDEYAGAIPWKLEVIDNSNSLVRKNITGQCAVKVAEKTRLNVLQIVSEGDTKYFKNNVYLPTDDEISKASEVKGRGAVTEANMMDYFDDCIESINVLRDEIAGIEEKYQGLARDEMEKVLANSGMFHYYLSKLEEFDVHFDRLTVGEFEQKVKEENEANKENEDKDDFLQTRFMDKYDMVILGYADCYKDVNSEACKAIDTFIEEGKTTLFTHDTTSFVNLDKTEYQKANDATGESANFWGYNINRYFRKIVGMDRYNATDNQGDKKLIDVNDDSYDKPYKTDTDQDKNEFEVDDSSGRALNQGMSNPILYIEKKTNEKGEIVEKVVQTGSYTSDSVTKTNDGQIVSYPYNIPDKLDVATTHAQYYQLNLEEDDIVVWYCIGQPKEGSRWCYSQNNDVRNNYYIYNKGNITYSGAGHSSGMTEQEIKLFINTMIAAYSASVQAPVPTITNSDKSTDNNDTDFVYVDYDATVSPEESKPLGSGVFDNTIKAIDGSKNKDVKTKRVFFKVANNSIAMNKELTVHYFPAMRDSSGNIRLLSQSPLPLKTYRVDDKSKKNSKNHEGASQVSEVEINVPEKVVAGSKNSKRKLTGGVIEPYEEYYVDVPITDNYYEDIKDSAGNQFTALDNKNQFAIQIQVIMRYGKDRDAKLPLRGYRNLFIMRRGMFALD